MVKWKVISGSLVRGPWLGWPVTDGSDLCEGYTHELQVFERRKRMRSYTQSRQALRRDFQMRAGPSAKPRIRGSDDRPVSYKLSLHEGLVHGGCRAA